MYKIILAPTEGSDTERTAISVAVKLAQRFEAELRLVRVEATPLVSNNVARPPVLEITERTLLDERLARLHKLEALGTECRALGEIRVMVALEEGRVAPTLCDYARKFHVDLIVMSSHSRGGLKRITLGSVTDYLIRRSNIPVLVIRQDSTLFAPAPLETIPHIVVPLDGSARAEQILPEVAAVALRLKATISLLRVLTPQTYSQGEIMQPGLPWWDEDISAADADLARASRYLVEEGLAVTTDVILSDNVPSAILGYASRTRADLIAIATRGAGGVNRFVFGSVADEVTRSAPTSLLVFHPLVEVPSEQKPVLSETRVKAGV